MNTIRIHKKNLTFLESLAKRTVKGEKRKKKPKKEKNNHFLTSSKLFANPQRRHGRPVKNVF